MSGRKRKSSRRVRRSAGLLLYRRTASGALEVFLAHPGGPYWANKDAGVWTVPRGEPDDGEEMLSAARREFGEETGLEPPEGPFLPLGEITQKGGKVVTAWACLGDCDASRISSNMTKVEWPPRSGKRISVPEIDRCGWFGMVEARDKIKDTQVPLLERLEEIVLMGGTVGGG